MPHVSRARSAKRDAALEAGGDQLRRWVDRLGSDTTRDVWPRVLGTFCVDVGRSPTELVEAATDGNGHPGAVSRTIQQIFEDYDKRMRAKGKKGSTIAFSIKVAKSWLAYCGVVLPRGFVKVRDSDRVYREAALSREQERAILHAANRRERAAIALARAGLRPEVQGNYLGTDGLRVRDLPDLKIDLRARTVSWSRVPARVVVRQELSKAHHEFSTFLTEENAELVAEYLGVRLRPSADWKKGEKLGPETPVIAPTSDGRHFIRTTNIGDILRNAIRKAGLTARPYVFRTTFQTRLASAEADGQLPHRLAVFWMGHSGEMSSRYAEQRGNLAPETVEEMREAFHRCEPFFSSSAPSASHANRDVGMLKAILELLGVPKGKVSEDELKNATPEQLKELAEKYRGQSSDTRQRVVTNGEIPKLLGEGWTFVAALEAGQAVLKPPGQP
jgi:hypothetical protein